MANSDTYAVRLTASNEDHKKPRMVMDYYLRNGDKAQDVLIKALCALGEIPAPPPKPNENELVGKLFQLIASLERAVNRIENMKGTITAGDVRQVMSEEIDDNFLDSIGSYFDSTQK